jgi:2',3'-cyclic-nucleotide 2'-phosphodiesterase (5'-nucleotidase family)
MKSLTSLFCLIFAAFFVVPAGTETTLTIYYTASLNGNLDGCTCDMNPVAGLVKRAAFLRTLEPSGPALILDAGDIFDEYPDPDLAKHILEVYEELNYDAIAVGDQELSNGLGALLDYRERSPLVCHNLMIQRSPKDDEGLENQLFTPGSVVITRKGLHIGIFCLIDPAATIDWSDKGIEIADPIPAAKAMQRRYNKMNLTVLLYHGPFEKAVELVDACPGIDLAIVAHEQRLLPPRRIGKTVFASPGKDGNHLGILTLQLDQNGIEILESKFIFFSYENDPDDPSVRKRIDTYRQKLRARLY